jgi:hypothetical protein
LLDNVVFVCYLVASQDTSDNLGQTSLPRQHFLDVTTETFAPLQHAAAIKSPFLIDYKLVGLVLLLLAASHPRERPVQALQ